MKKKFTIACMLAALSFSIFSACAQGGVVEPDIEKEPESQPQTETYTITWIYDDGTILEVDKNVEKGSMPSYDGKTPTKADEERCSYNFIGWDYEISAVTGDKTYTAKFERIEKTIGEPKSIFLSLWNTLAPGLSAKLNVDFLPSTAYSGLTFTSSDPSVATVDEYGKVTALKKGTTTITATAYNGVKGSCMLIIDQESDKLTYELTADGKGYCITDCEATALSAHIPATYNGLPVKQIADRAFINCEQLRAFTVDKEQKYFYEVDGVLYTDSPVKTLVRFPNRYGSRSDNECSFTVDRGTVAIGNYAFAGLRFLLYLHIPEGVTTMGDRVFAEINCQTFVYVPDSLVKIGKELMLNQKGNVPFYGSSNCYAAEYARRYQIPYGAKYDYTPLETTVNFLKLTPDSAQKYSSSDKIYYWSGERVRFSTGITNRQDISSYQDEGYQEVRLQYSSVWGDMIPDKNGNKLSSWPAMTGVYGMGYTQEPALLVGFDGNGNPTGTYSVSGNFIFSFPGAMELGVVGGKGTHITAVPYEPKFIDAPGDFRVETADLIRLDKNIAFQNYIFAYSNSVWSPSFPDGLSFFYENTDTMGVWVDRDDVENYIMTTLNINDAYAIDQSYNLVVRAGGMITLLDKDGLLVNAKQSYNLTQEYADKVYQIYNVLKQTMVGTYYPKDVAINKILVSVNGNYPTSFMSKIELDEYCLTLDSGTLYAIAHEMTHAVDQSAVFSRFHSIASPWLEGRAEYIAELVLDKLGVEYPTYGEEYDWSFLGKEEREDFFSYYCYSTNRNTEYPVGYYFFKYLCEKYGEDISAKIIKNLEDYFDSENQMNGLTQAEYAVVFKKCITSVTSENVFQDFVRDVIEK